jgi:hypothetical protein
MTRSSNKLVVACCLNKKTQNKTNHKTQNPNHKIGNKAVAPGRWSLVEARAQQAQRAAAAQGARAGAEIAGRSCV